VCRPGSMLRVASALLLVGPCAALPHRPASPHAIDPISGEANAGECNPNWCDCESEACAKPSTPDEQTCNLCDRKWTFVIAAGGRTGSTSILEGLNALPGVSLFGENYALLDDLRSVYDKVQRLVNKNNKAGDDGAAAYYLPQTKDVANKILCAQQSFMASLSEAPQDANAHVQILGFKELVSLPSEETADPDGGSHLSGAKMDWLHFLDVLFPCSKVVFSMRRDTTSQARAIFSLFEQSRGAKYAWEYFQTPLMQIENELSDISSKMITWHDERSAKGSRSFLMYTEDFSPELFTQLAQWIGVQDCAFHNVPTANEADPAQGEGKEFFHKSSTAINVTCGHVDVSGGDIGLSEQIEQTTKQSASYIKALEDDADSKECEGVYLPHNEACVGSGPPSPLREHKAQESHIDLDDIPKFYIHEEGHFDFSNTVKCFLRAVDASTQVDNLDAQVFPDVSEHFVDYWLLERFRSHANRVWDPDEAQLHVLGSPLVAAFRAHRGFNWDLDWEGETRSGGNMGGALGCGTMEQFYQQTAEISAYLKNSYYWNEHNGKNWLVLNSYYWVTDTWGEELLATLLSGPAIITSSDNAYRDFEAIHKVTGKVPIIPYKADYRLDDFAWVQMDFPSHTRSQSLMFHGTTERGIDGRNDEGALRQRICDELKPEFKDANLRCVHHWMSASATELLAADAGSGSKWTPENKGMPTVAIPGDMEGDETVADAAVRVAEEHNAGEAHGSEGGPIKGTKEPDTGVFKVPTVDSKHRHAIKQGDTYRTRLTSEGNVADPRTVKGYVDSKLCLVPAGDTPTSRRLFDSLAAGCVPILLVPPEDIAPNLPFPKAINWHETALFGGRLSCALGGNTTLSPDKSKQTIQWIRNLLSPENEKALTCASKRSQRVFRKYLSYREEGPVNALLEQLMTDQKYASVMVKKNATNAKTAGATAPLDSNGTRLVSEGGVGTSKCHVENQCGCRGSGKNGDGITTVFIRYHKTGCVLSEELMSEYDQTCDIRTTEIKAAATNFKDAQQFLGHKLTRRGRCNNIKISLAAGNSGKWTEDMMAGLARPRENVRFIHLIREPLKLVASYYTYHMAGFEATFPVYRDLYKDITNMTVDDGIKHVAQLVLDTQLPQMLRMKEFFTVNNTEKSRRADTIEIRLEDFDEMYWSTANNMMLKMGMDESCMVGEHPVKKAVMSHDLSDMSDEDKAKDPHGHWSREAAGDDGEPVSWKWSGNGGDGDGDSRKGQKGMPKVVVPGKTGDKTVAEAAVAGAQAKNKAESGHNSYLRAVSDSSYFQSDQVALAARIRRSEEREIQRSRRASMMFQRQGSNGRGTHAKGREHKTERVPTEEEALRRLRDFKDLRDDLMKYGQKLGYSYPKDLCQVAPFPCDRAAGSSYVDGPGAQQEGNGGGARQ